MSLARAAEPRESRQPHQQPPGGVRKFREHTLDIGGGDVVLPVGRDRGRPKSSERVAGQQLALDRVIEQGLGIAAVQPHRRLGEARADEIGTPIRGVVGADGVDRAVVAEVPAKLPNALGQSLDARGTKLGRTLGQVFVSEGAERNRGRNRLPWFNKTDRRQSRMRRVRQCREPIREFPGDRLPKLSQADQRLQPPLEPIGLTAINNAESNAAALTIE